MTAALTAEELAAMEAEADAVYPVQGWSNEEAASRAFPVVTEHVPALLAEVRRLTAALDGVRREERERVVAAVAKVREGWPRVEGAPDELAMSAARMALSEVADAWDALADATGSAT